MSCLHRAGPEPLWRGELNHWMAAAFISFFQVAGASGLSEKYSIGTLAHFALNDTQLSIFFFCKLPRDTSLTLLWPELALQSAASGENQLVRVQSEMGLGKGRAKLGWKAGRGSNLQSRALGASRWDGFSFQLKTGIYPEAAKMSQLRLAPSGPGTNPQQALLRRLKPNCTRDMKVNNGRRQMIALVEGNIENLKRFLDRLCGRRSFCRRRSHF